MRDFAGRLIAYETRANKSSRTNPAAAFQVCEKLRPQLAIMIGNGGFRALLTRAIALAKSEVPWLGTVQVKADGSLAGLEDIEVQADPEDIARGGVVLVARLLGLLVAFIGEKLMLRIVCDVWPELAPND